MPGMSQKVSSSRERLSFRMNNKVPLQDAANERKLRLESLLESQKEKALRKRSMITRLKSECNEIQEQVACVKKRAQNLVDNLMRVIEAKKQELLKEGEGKAQQSIERLVEQQSDVEKELWRIETSIKETERFLMRSTNAEIGSEGDQEGEFDYPTGIAYLNNGKIVVADSIDNRLQIFTERGQYLTQIGGEGNLDHQFNYPWGLSVHRDGNIIVTDPDNKLIKIFNPSGQFLRKFGEDLLVVPRHCIQKNQYFIVSDNGDHCIKVFNTDGDFLYKFGNEGDGYGEFDRPHYLSVDKAGHLMVCDSANDRVQILELSGEFITEFGLMSDRIENYVGPIYTAVLTDGRIVLVSDYCDDCIKIFE